MGELVDTHNALNHQTGTFTAPFDGVYGFFFDSFFRIDSEYGYSILYAYHNSQKFSIYNANTSDDKYGHGSSAVYFALKLKQNDTVKINSGNSNIHLYLFPATFMGFLLQ